MQDARHHQRIAYHLPVDIYCGPQEERRECKTRDIGLGGFFAVGATCVRENDKVHVELGPNDGDKLHLSGRVARISHGGAGLQFVGNSPATLEVLRALLVPDWDGGNLLDGVVKIAPWYRENDLAGWMRLTSIVSDWRRLTQQL